MSTTKPVPDGASVVMPMLVCRDAGAELEFCKTPLAPPNECGDQAQMERLPTPW